MSYRKISGLRWAMCVDESPWGKAKRRPKGAKGKGLQYEASIAKMLPQAMHGQWMRFADSQGEGFAQPDFLLEFPFADAILILESKLSWVPEAYGQIEYLYKPLVEKIWQKPAFGIVVTKNLTPDCRGLDKFQYLDEAAQAACSSGRTVLLHWFSGPLFSPRVHNVLRERANGAYAVAT